MICRKDLITSKGRNEAYEHLWTFMNPEVRQHISKKQLVALLNMCLFLAVEVPKTILEMF